MGARLPLSLAAWVREGAISAADGLVGAARDGCRRDWKHEMSIAGSDGRLRQQVRSDALNLCPKQTREQNNTARHL